MSMVKDTRIYYALFQDVIIIIIIIIIIIVVIKFHIHGFIQNFPDWCRHLHSSCGSAMHW
jgi:hypothetical protein